MLILSNDIPNEIGPNNWLTDLSINGAMGLLRQQFADIGALISCQWGAILQFDRADSQKWIQIINIHNNHWVMAAQGFGINPNNVLLYDSLDTTEPHPHVVYCIAQLCKTPIGKLTISLMPCQVQKDGLNCGFIPISNQLPSAYQDVNPKIQSRSSSVEESAGPLHSGFLTLPPVQPAPAPCSLPTPKETSTKNSILFTLWSHYQATEISTNQLLEEIVLELRSSFPSVVSYHPMNINDGNIDAYDMSLDDSNDI
ncbi:hypothetical protein OUZ56_017054 [Daphnia magna]|uniref:Uncharacterized protein n=1 Tax=Daphnia magna TaxID=35525 RepID=A0ABR0ASH5_9CRUS|nr:hypothetical protein OUZ56_017054 [Daphnia magna]